MEKVYSLENKEAGRIELSPEQETAIRNITLGLEEVDPAVIEMAVDDVVATLNNGHLLNRLITAEDGKLCGYVACEDFILMKPI